MSRNPSISLFMTHSPEHSFRPDSLPRGVVHWGPLTSAPHLLQRNLESWRPAALALIGGGLEPAPMHLAAQLDVPLLLAHMNSPEMDLGWRIWPGLGAALLKSCHRILLPDDAALRAFRRAGAPKDSCIVAGPLCETAPVLAHTEAERQEITARLAARPVWLAAGLPRSEVPTVLRAHAEIRRLAHRLLLILVPSQADLGQMMAETIAATGAHVSRRSAEQDIDPEDHVYVADTDGEYGLWYRLAPVVFMGGSLSPSGGGSVRDPMEAAALGSAILHGSSPGAWADSYRVLSGAGATRPLRNGAELADCLSDLLAPDRAAELACEGWRVFSEGSEATERMADELLALMPAPGIGTGALR